MKNIIVKGIVLAVLTIAVVGIVVGQGLYWESTTTIPMANGREIHSTSNYRPHMIRQSSENNAMIFRLDKEMMYMVDTEKKEYSEMTFAEMEAYAKKANKKLEGKMAEMNEQLKNMPPEQRKAMEDMMGSVGMGGKNAKIDVTKTTEKKTISGYTCIKYVMKENGKEIGNVWTTTGVPDFSAMQKDIKEFSQRMAAQMPKAGEMVVAMKKVDGFPVQTTIAGITTIVTKIEKKTAAASEFEVPAGYKKVAPKNLTDD
jgi:GLPGLI family protein